MNRKGQAALEFLMTYGWAILVVLAAIGALAYFGVLSPSNFLPETCAATSGAACLGKPVISSNSVIFTLTNGVGQTISLDNANTSKPAAGSIAFCDKGLTSCASNSTKQWSDGTDATFIYVPTTPLTNSFKGVFQLNYTNANSGLKESVVVNVAGKVK